jgi:xylan 1,4-beta-xylosidase
MKIKPILLVLSISISSIYSQNITKFNINLNKTIGPMKPIWAWFGADEPNYAYMKDGKKLLGELSAMSKTPVYFRTHNLFTSGHDTLNLKWGSTNVYTEDAAGSPIYDWTIVDKIFDAYQQKGIKPLAQFGFMPEAMSTHPTPYEHHWQPGEPYDKIYTGWTYPPKDYQKWGKLVEEFVKHAVARYGKTEVETWYWELWNEPNIKYWSGTVEEFCKLYDYTVAAARSALPTIIIGGPDTTGPSWDKAGIFLKYFLTHCDTGTNYVTGKIGTPIDFISFHAKGGPKIVNSHVQMNMGTQLRDVDAGMKIVASYEKFKNLPIIIGECDPEGCAACGMKTNPQNAYRNGTMYSSYTVASYARLYDLEQANKVNLLGAVSWSFEFENQPYFYGFRDLATNGIDKPVLNVFRMFGKMGGNRVEVLGNTNYNYAMIRDSSVRKLNDIGAIASKNSNSATALIWNYHDDDIIGNSEKIELVFEFIPTKKLKISHYRIDQSHSNSYEFWKKMGSPQNPNNEQYTALEKAGALALFENPKKVIAKNGKFTLNFDLPKQGVSLVKLDW